MGLGRMDERKGFGDRDLEFRRLHRPVEPLEFANSGNSVIGMALMPRRFLGTGSTPLG